MNEVIQFPSVLVPFLCGPFPLRCPTLMEEQSGLVSSTLAPFAVPFSHSHVIAAQAQPSQRKPGRILVHHELDFSILHAVGAECG